MNTNTVLRALRALRDEGILEFRVAARELVELARTHGYRREELLRLVDELL